MYYVYLLFSLKYKKFYTGFTNNLQRRIEEHKQGLVYSTRNYEPMELAYYEAYKNKQDAIEREQYFKTGWGRNYCKRILKNYLRDKY